MEDVIVESRDFESLKFPGSPTRGFSSIYSFPYLKERSQDSASIRKP